MGKSPPRMFVTTDAVTLAWTREHALQVLLIKRANPPYPGYWALPGGFVEEDEDLPDACARELKEETGIRPVAMVQIGAWGKPDRDPRGRNVSVAFLCLTRWYPEEVVPGDDAAATEWHPANDLPRLAFDHGQMVQAGLERLRHLALETHAIFALLPDPFQMDEFRQAMEDVTGQLFTDREALRFMKRAGVVKQLPAGGAPIVKYRCVRPDYLAPLST